MYKWLAVILLVVVLGSGAWYILAEKSGSAPAEVGVTEGKLAPQFSLENLQGKYVAVGTGKQVTVINFWATWCPPCREEIPELLLFAAKHKADLAFWAVNIQESSDSVSAFCADHNYALPVLLDSDGKIAAIFEVNAIPTTLVLDKRGVIRFRKTGGVTRDELENVLKGL